MKNDNIIAIKSKKFAIRIINMYKYLCSAKREYVLSKQLLRSGTSIGANVRESEYAQSTADFISKLQIALKEANESVYWLELLSETEFITESQFISMSSDCVEIIKILTSIINSLKNNNY
ncbi:MAG: four helix bundle protein [Ruminococcus sp.]|nr:four helix bundle protein [Ruminococcus sp.]MCM1481008.1 four helix bundle protein [Muribaculaceae bacterium]